MGKKTTLLLTLIPLIIYGLIFGLVLMIPAVSSKNISVGYYVSDATIFDSTNFKIAFVEGHTYSIVCDTDTFWGMDVSLYLYQTPFQVSGLKVDSVSNSGEQFHFTAEKTGQYYIKVKGAFTGFFDFSVTETTVVNSATPENNVNVGKLLSFIIPFVVILVVTLGIGLIIRMIVNKRPLKRAQEAIEKEVKRAEEGKGPIAKVEEVFQGLSDAITSSPYLQKNFSSDLPVTYAKPEEGRVNDLKQIFKRYKSISLEEMTQLLDFQDTIALQNWLLDLPNEITFVIDKGYVIIPAELQEETAEAETKINEIAQSLSSLKHFTCYYCGIPLEKDNQFCPDCGEKLLTCSVCKLPIAFGDDVGKCSLCEKEGHLTHLQEWIKIKGECPVCMQKLTWEGIIPLAAEDGKKSK